MTYVIVFLPFAGFFAWLYGTSVWRARPGCPDCGVTLDAFQSPFTKSRRQWEQGGYLCRNCGCETDGSGVKVPRGQAPHWPMALTMFTLPVIGLAFFVLSIILMK